MLTNCTRLNEQGIVSIQEEGKNQKKESEDVHEVTEKLLTKKTDQKESIPMNIKGILSCSWRIY